MQLLATNKQTNTSDIFGGVTAFLRWYGLEDTKYRSRLFECFSRKKLDKFEDDNYRIEKKATITTNTVR